MSVRSLVLAMAVAMGGLVLGSCASMSADGNFLMTRLDDRTKSQILVEAGANEWNAVVVEQGKIDKINEIREYFVVALHYNPQNQSAYRWLTTVDDYRTAKVRDTISDARSMLKNKQRKEDDDYALALAVRKASAIDPNNAEVVKLVNDTQAVRGNLATVYVKRANATLDRLKPNSSDAAKEAAYIDAFQNAVRATNADPRDAQASTLRGSLSSTILGIIRKRLDSVPKLYDAAKFTPAKGQIDMAADLNRKTNGEFNSQINEAYYTLYYRWAKYNFQNKDYPQAENRINIALDYRRTQEGVDLQKRISKIRDEIDQGATFETNLQNIDKLIASGDLVPAQRQVISAGSIAKDQANMEQLEARRKKIHNALADVYARAVQQYKSEDFAGAIDSLEVITAIEPGYEKAADYLEKARQKKRLLDNY